MTTIIGTETLYEATDESLAVTIRSTVDPTGDPPEFALSAPGAFAPGTFVPGAWDGSWNATTQEARALTPKIGGSSSLTIDSGNRYSLWVRCSAGSETPVWVVGKIICP